MHVGRRQTQIDCDRAPFQVRQAELGRLADFGHCRVRVVQSFQPGQLPPRRGNNGALLLRWDFQKADGHGLHRAVEVRCLLQNRENVRRLLKRPHDRAVPPAQDVKDGRQRRPVEMNLGVKAKGQNQFPRAARPVVAALLRAGIDNQRFQQQLQIPHHVRRVKVDPIEQVATV